MERHPRATRHRATRPLLAACLALTITLAGAIFPNVSCAARPKISAPHYVLMDAATGQVLLEASSTNKAFPASTTKILTAYVVLSKTGLQNVLTVPKEAKVGGSHIFLAPGDTISLEDALYGLLLSSANDAAVTLAHAVSGSVSEFAAAMNAAARELGATNSNFTNPHGLPDNNHYTTALDLALITREALKNPAFARFVVTKTREITITSDGGERRETLTNHNNMLGWYEGCTGVKTGFTQQSKHCMVASAKRDSLELIAVTLGGPSSSSMWRDAQSLLDYGFAVAKPKEVLKSGQVVFEGKLEKGKTDLTGVAAQSFSILETESYPEVTVKAELDSELKPPVKAGQKVGTIKISQAGRVISEVDMTARDAVARAFAFGLPAQVYAIPAALGLALLALNLNRRSQRRVKARTRTTRPAARPRSPQRQRWREFQGRDL